MITMEEAKKLALSGAYKRIPVSRELYADQRTPVEVLKILKATGEPCYLFESGEGKEQDGRYTYLGYAPIMKLSCKDGTVTVSGPKGTKTKETKDPKEVIRQVLKDYRSMKPDGMPGFTGGFAGYFSYDFMKYKEPSILGSAQEKEGFLDAQLMLFDKVIAFDHFRQKITLIANVDTSDLEVDYFRAENELKELENLIRNGAYDSVSVPNLKITKEFGQMFDQEDYCLIAEMCREYIREGDSLVMVLSNCMEAEMEGSLLNAYRVLRVFNPLPYMCYLSWDGMEVAATAPGSLLKLCKERLYTSILTGKRFRGESKKEDMRIERELLADKKEQAWHHLLADLGRNDMGKLCRINTMKMEGYGGASRYSHAMYVSSAISGRILKGLDGLDAVEAFLPVGATSGGPKLKNSQLIYELEQHKRGLYGGMIGYLDFSGDLDFCTPAQLVSAKDGKLFVRSSAKIGAASKPEQVYQEYVNQAGPVLHALEVAQKGEEL